MTDILTLREASSQYHLSERTPHSLRHTYASISLAAGLPLAYVSKQLGHSNPSITLEIYCHWVPGSPAEKTCALDRKSTLGLNRRERNESREQ